MNRTRIEKLQKPLTTETTRIPNILEDNNADTDEHLKERLPIINCECGAEILLLPDLQAMNRAIKAHVAKNKKKRRNAHRNTTSRNISQLLSQLSLIKISAQNNTWFLDSDREKIRIHAFHFRSNILICRLAVFVRAE
jgi:hypothetical protein